MEKELVIKNQQTISVDKQPLVLAFAVQAGVVYGQHQKTGDIYWWSKTEKEWILYKVII